MSIRYATASGGLDGGSVSENNTFPDAVENGPLTLDQQLEALAVRARGTYAVRLDKTLRWKWSNYFFGTLAALLAFFAGATVLADWFGDIGRDVAAIVSFASGLCAT